MSTPPSAHPPTNKRKDEQHAELHDKPKSRVKPNHQRSAHNNPMEHEAALKARASSSSGAAGASGSHDQDGGAETGESAEGIDGGVATTIADTGSNAVAISRPAPTVDWYQSNPIALSLLLVYRQSSVALRAALKHIASNPLGAVSPRYSLHGETDADFRLREELARASLAFATVISGSDDAASMSKLCGGTRAKIEDSNALIAGWTDDMREFQRSMTIAQGWRMECFGCSAVAISDELNVMTQWDVPMCHRAGEFYEDQSVTPVEDCLECAFEAEPSESDRCACGRTGAEGVIKTILISTAKPRVALIRFTYEIMPIANGSIDYDYRRVILSRTALFPGNGEDEGTKYRLVGYITTDAKGSRVAATVFDRGVWIDKTGPTIGMAGERPWDRPGRVVHLALYERAA